MNSRVPITPENALGTSNTFNGRLALQQRVLPAYRAPFFDLLARSCRDGLSVFAGESRPDEMIRNAENLTVAEWVHADNTHIFSGAWYLLWQSEIEAWLKSINPDALILEANPRYLSNRIAIDWMHARGRPVIGWALGAPDVQGLLAPLRRFMRKRYLLRLDALIAYSRQGADEYQALGFPEERIHIAYNAADPKPKVLPERGGFRGRKPRVLFVGRLQQRKRVDLLLKACSKVEQDVELVIIGDGPAGEEIHNCATDIFPQARFVGAVYGEELRDWFKWADIFVLPGTGGLAVQQAMASGLPVIVAEGDGTQADLVSADNGWLVKPGDGKRLTKVLSRALEDPELLVEMGRRSYELSVNRFNIEAMVAVFVNALEKVSKV